MSVESEPAMSREEFDSLFGAILATVEKWKLNSAADHMREFARRPGRKSRDRKPRKQKPSKLCRREEYERYMKSPLWQAIRKEVLDRDDHKCMTCGDPANEVHHRSYSPEVMDGRDNSKLTSLCGRCHNRIHYGSDNFKLTRSKTEKLLSSMILRHSKRSGSVGHNALMTRLEMN